MAARLACMLGRRSNNTCQVFPSRSIMLWQVYHNEQEFYDRIDVSLRGRLSCLQRSHRNFCSSSPADITTIPLSQSVPWLPTPKYAPPIDYNHKTEVTTLDNGLRVASEQSFGQFCTMGVLIDSGSRYEALYPSGISHFLQKLAFQSTTKFGSRDDVMRLVEEYGGIFDCQSSRDVLIYALSAETRGLPHLLDLMSEVVFRPLLSPEEMEDTRNAVYFENEAMEQTPFPDQILTEMIHAAAYSHNTLGLPKFTPAEGVSSVDQGTLYTYLHKFHTPDRMVVAGVGVDHKDFVEFTKNYFNNKKCIWDEKPELIDNTKTQDLSISQYTGGIVTGEKDLSDVSPGPTPIPELAHCVIGLESCSHQDPDFVAFCVLNMMLGGGGSFSAGGPGKGMYARLYLNVLNKYLWMYSATAMNHAYADSGVFCIHASAHPSHLRDLVSVIVKELVTAQHGISQSELNRAKTQLQSTLLMNLESRPIMFEDVGRQVLASGERLPATHYFDEIGAITPEDIQRVVRRMLDSNPSVAAMGSLSQLPSFDDIRTGLASRDGRLPRRFSLLRGS